MQAGIEARVHGRDLWAGVGTGRNNRLEIQLLWITSVALGKSPPLLNLAFPVCGVGGAGPGDSEGLCNLVRGVQLFRVLGSPFSAFGPVEGTFLGCLAPPCPAPTQQSEPGSWPPSDRSLRVERVMLVPSGSATSVFRLALCFSPHARPALTLSPSFGKSQCWWLGHPF